MISINSPTEQAVTILPTCYQQAQHAAHDQQGWGVAYQASESPIGWHRGDSVAWRSDLGVASPELKAKPTPKKKATAVAVDIAPPGREPQAMYWGERDSPDPERLAMWICPS